MRHLTFLMIGLAAGTWLGTQIEAGMFSRESPDGYAIGDAPYQNLSDDRKHIWPSDIPAPDITMDLQPDPASGHNLFVTTAGFRMTPEDVNGPMTPAAGHGHLFVNGENIGRLYGNALHLIDLPKGEVTIHMYLSANDHKVWIIDEEPLFIEKTFMIE